MSPWKAVAVRMTSVGITTQLKYCRTGPPSGISRLWPAGGGSHTTVSTSPPYNTASREEPGGPPCQEMSPVRWLARPGGVVSTVDPWRVRDIGQCLCRHNIQTHTATRLSSPNTSWSADTLPLSTPLCLHPPDWQEGEGVGQGVHGHTMGAALQQI